MLPKKNSGIFSDGRCRRRCCCHRRLIAAASAVVVRFQRLILRWCESINENRNIQHAFFPSSHKASNVCETETLWRNSFLRSFLLDVIWIFLFFKVFHYSVKAISSRRRQFNNSDHLLANSVYLETQASFCNNFFFILPLRFFCCFRLLPHHLTFADCYATFNIILFILLNEALLCVWFFSTIWYETWRVTWMCHFNLFHSFWFYNYG